MGISIFNILFNRRNAGADIARQRRNTCNNTYIKLRIYLRMFSHNTVYDKLRAARLRNDCTSNDELLKKYIEEYANQYAAGSK